MFQENPRPRLSVSDDVKEFWVSKDKTLRVYSGSEGGAQHCHMDYLQPVVSYMADWTAEKLGA